jgi:hypothetical protein
MAFSPRPDGLNDLYLDDGTRVVSPLPAAQLQEMGHQQVAPGGIPALPPGPGLDSGATAQNEYAGQIQGLLNAPQPQVQQPGMGPPPPPSVLDAPGGFKVIGDAPTVNGHARPDFQTGVQQIQAEAPRTDTSLPKRKLVPLGAPGQQPAYGQPGYGAPQQRVMKVKGGDVRASFTRTPGEEVPEDIKRDALSTTPEDLEINADSIATQREELRQKREQQIQDQQAMLDREAVRRAHVDQTLAAKQDVVNQRDREIDKMRPGGMKDVIKDMGVFGQLSAALTMIAGGYQAGLTGGQNAGYGMIRDTIQQGIADQRAAYEEAKERGETARNDYAHAIALYGTPEAAALDLEMRHIGVAEKMLENRAGKIQDQEYLNNANQAANELRQQRAEVKLKLMEIEKGKTLQENYVNVPDRYVGSGGPAKVKKEDGEREVRLPDGQYMFARDATQARKLQDVVKANARLSQLSGRLKGLTDTVGKREPTAAERAAADTIKSEMMFTYKDASQAGALDKGLQDAMEGYFGKATDVFRVEDVPRKLEEVKRIADGKVHEVVRYDLHPDPNYSPGVAMPPAGESDE